MALKPPQHRVDAPAIYVSKDDPAWDTERIDREADEQSKINEAAEKAAEVAGEPEPDLELDHPVWRYKRGETRWDIHAPDKIGGQTVCAADYLKEGAIEWLLRPLTPDEELAYLDIAKVGGEYQAYGRACKWGLIECRSGQVDVMRDKDGVTNETLGEIRGLPGRSIASIIAIGSAVVVLTMPITAAEGKRSGS